MLLSELEEGEKGIITKIKGREVFRKRLMEMGFVIGQPINIIKKAPLGGPIEYQIMGYRGLLRKNQTNYIEIEKIDLCTINNATQNSQFKIAEITDHIKLSNKTKSKDIQILFIGNPNSGKTTLFNLLTNQNEKVGNYSGITIEPKKGVFEYKDYKFHITDTPGIYSLSTHQNNTKDNVQHYFNQNPDIIVNIIDANNLERNLYLTTDLLDTDIKSMVLLNMYDEFTEKGNTLNYEAMGKMIGRPIIPIVASKNKGIESFLSTLINLYEDKDQTIRHTHIFYGHLLEDSIKKIQKLIFIPKNITLTDQYSTRFLSVKLLEKDNYAQELIQKTCENSEDILEVTNHEIKKIEKNTNSKSENLIAEAKYGFIAGALKENKTEKKDNTSFKNIDSILTHKLLGFPIFALFMWLTFFTTFKLGEYPMNWIEKGVALISNIIASNLTEGYLKDLLIDGIIGGVGGVIVFLPNILILFFFISLIEDTGYMSRAVFIMDNFMHKIGLHGKSFIPLVMGFGCNVPAIMSSRILENKNERLITILINPFISCNARLPIYILLISAFFPNHPTLILFSIYAFGIVAAITTSLILKKFYFKTEEAPFVMELPPYRMPAFNIILKHMWERGSQYLKKIGGVILLASIIFWALSYFPRNINYSKNYQSEINHVNNLYNKKIAETHVSKHSEITLLSNTRDSIINQIEKQKQFEQKEKSYIGYIGKFIEPCIKPLGFDWKIGISLLSGIPAKEIIVSTLGVLYQSDDNTSSASLSEKLKTQKQTEGINKGKPLFNQWNAYAFMIFVLLYFPCIGTITAIIKESKSWKWGVATIIYSVAIAWISAFLIIQIGSLI